VLFRSADAAEAVVKDPEATLSFIKLLREANPKSLAEDILNIVKPNLKDKTSEQAAKRAKKLSENIVGKYKTSIDELSKSLDGKSSEQQISEVRKLLEDPRNKLIIQEAAKNLGPIKILDGKMRNILSAHELLTGKSIPKTDIEKIDNVMELFKNISGQTKEGVSADITKAKYDKAMDLLGSALPEVSNEIEQMVKPAVNELFMVRYLHGIGFDPALKDSAIVQKTLGTTPKLAAQTANLSAQALESAKKGVSGPIVGLPTSFALRPTVSTLRTIKNMVDSQKGPIPKIISEQLQTALNSQDEGRRIAILNTLMSYDYFRNMVKDINVEE
jgi:hypothetical protein